ncbi:MAG: hypothetical protein NT029_08075 [Armatimonadetes bacterium]|nr:hypothetical protein [Armatimonadota bacterium]
MAGSLFSAKAYYSAAMEHLDLSVRLARTGEHLAAHYFAGVAAEAMLRAHALRVGQAFTSNHSIRFLAGQAGLVGDGNEDGADALQAVLLELEMRWRANHRYLSRSGLVLYLNSAGLDRRVRGDRIKFSATRMVEMAGVIVAEGVRRWKR